MNEALKVSLLKLIKYDGSVELIRKKGYEYAQILEFIETLLSEGYVEFNDNQLSLTTYGHEILNSNQGKSKEKGTNRWLYTQSDYWYKPQSAMKIYLP